MTTPVDLVGFLAKELSTAVLPDELAKALHDYATLEIPASETDYPEHISASSKCDQIST